MLLDEDRDLLESAEAAHGLEGREGHGQLRLVVVVDVVRRVLGVETLGPDLARVGLDAQRLARAEDLEQERELSPRCVLEGRTVPQRRGSAGMSPDPELGVGSVGIDLVDDPGLEREARHAAVEAAYPPRVVLDDRAEGEDV